MTDMKAKPKVNSQGMQELDKAQEQIDQASAQIKDVLTNRNDAAPRVETEPLHKMSNREIQGMKETYLKPVRSVASKEKFNERFRSEYEFMKQYVPFIAEHNEMKGEMIEQWTKPFAGMPAEYWNIPTGVPVWGPRYLAEDIKKRFYHRLTMRNVATTQDGLGTMFGQLAADTTVQRLDARPVNQGKSIFMGPSGN